MDDTTYDALAGEIAEGRIAQIGGRTAASLDELDWLRGIGAKADGSTDVPATAATHTLTDAQLAAVIAAANAEAQDRIESLQADNDAQAGRIKDLQSGLSRAQADGAAKDTAVTALQGQADALAGQIRAQQAQIESQHQQIETLTAGNDSLKAENETLKAQTPAEDKAPGADAATPPAVAPAQDKAADKAAKQG